MFEENENNYPVKPELLVNRSSKNRMVILVVSLFLLFVSTNLLTSAYVVLLELILVLAVHEFSHFIMMRFFKSQAQGMFFLSFLGKMVTNLKPSKSLKQQTLINLMGPLLGILIGCTLFLIVIYSSPNFYLIELGLLFLGINLLNLLPIDPFDGGRIISGFFFGKNDQLNMIFSLVSSLVILAAGIYLNFWPLIIFGFLMGFKVRGFQKSSQLHEDLEETNINYKKEYKDLTNREYWLIRNTFLRHNPKLKEMIPSGFTLWENERLLMEQVKQILRVDTKSDISLGGKIAVILLILGLIALPVLLIVRHYNLIEWYMENVGI